MGFITRAVGRRVLKSAERWTSTPEAQDAIDRSRHVNDFLRTVKRTAGSDLDDEHACMTLRGQLPGDRELVDSAIKILGSSRTSYLDDRAFRLLTSAVDGRPVRPIDPAVSEQFSAEQRLGRMSLSDAFAYLVSLDSRIADQPARIDARRHSTKTRIKFGESDDPQIGAGVDNPNALLNTDLAADVISEYAAATKGGRQLEDGPTPYFERDNLTSSVRFLIGMSRPQATN